MNQQINLIDVGFAGGLSKPWSDNTNLISNLLAFEPRMKEVNLPHICIKNVAVFDTPGPRPFYIYKKERCSSLFQIAENANEILNDNSDLGRFDLKEIKEIQCERLDTIIDGMGIDFDVLKIDAQGADLNIIKSMGRHLPNLLGIHTEQHLKPLYKNIALLKDTDQYLAKYGFVRIARLRQKFSPVFNNYLYLKLHPTKMGKFHTIYSLYTSKNPLIKNII